MRNLLRKMHLTLAEILQRELTEHVDPELTKKMLLDRFACLVVCYCC